MIRRGLRLGRRGERGQTLVEFSLALIPFLFMLMGVVDLGRGIYTNNAVAQAAREIARVTSVHQCVAPCSSATWSSQTTSTVNAQAALVPGFSSSSVTIDCVDINDNAVTLASGVLCPVDDYVRVKVTVSFRLVTPFLPVPNPFTVSSTAHMQAVEVK